MKNTSAAEFVMDAQRDVATCAIITTYEPAENLGSLIYSLISQVPQVFLINDSGSAQVRKRLDIEFGGVPNLDLHHMTSNRGIAAALNRGLEAGSSLGYRTAVLLDDDTRIAPHLVEYLRRFWRQLESGGQKPGVVGVSRSEDALDFGIKKEIQASLDWRRVRGVITAGSMIDIELSLRAGGFREEFIIDAVDYEFCARIRQSGFLVAKLGTVLIEQPVGCVSTATIAGLRIRTTNHSPIRRYYMYRNNLILAGEQTFKDPMLSIAIVWFLFKTVVLITFMEDQRRSKLRAVYRGILDGVRRRGGQIGLIDQSGDS